MLDAVDAFVETGDGLGAMETGEELVRDNTVDKGGFARAGDAGDDSEEAEGELDIDVFEIVFAGADDAQEFARGFATFARRGELFFAGQVAAGDGICVLGDFCWGASGDDFPALYTSAGADVHEIVALVDGVFVVLDYDDGVPQIAQVLEGIDEFVVVALVEANGGFVQHIEYALETAADLGGQADALSFATR